MRNSIHETMHLIPNSSSYRILVYVKNNCSTTPTPHKLFFDKTPVSTKKEYASSLRDSIFAGLTPAFTGGQSHSERFVSFNFHFAASVTLCTPSPQYHRLRIQILGAYLCQICFFFVLYVYQALLCALIPNCLLPCSFIPYCTPLL